jgi:hypothetical protein
VSQCWEGEVMEEFLSRRLVFVACVLGGWVSYWAIMRSEREIPVIVRMAALVAMFTGGFYFVALCGWVATSLVGTSLWMVLLAGMFVIGGFLVLGWSIGENDEARAEARAKALAAKAQSSLRVAVAEAREMNRPETPPRAEARSWRPAAAAENRNLVANYGQVLEKFAGFELVDGRELPGTKEEIKRAIKMVWTNSDAQMKNMLSRAFVMLSMFQEGVGEPIATMASMASGARDIPPLPPESDHEARAAWTKAHSASIRAMAASITTQHDKIGGWSRVVTNEMKRLNDEFAAFKAERENK